MTKKDLLVLLNYYSNERARLYDESIRAAMAQYNKISTKINNLKHELRKIENG